MTLSLRINPSTGEISVNGPLDHQSAAVISLTVQARDLNAKERVEEQVARTEVTVYVQEFSDGNPLFTVGGWTPGSPVLKVAVPEEQPRGTVLYMLAAQDPSQDPAEGACMVHCCASCSLLGTFTVEFPSGAIHKLPS